jgi:hypothetical protein
MGYARVTRGTSKGNPVITLNGALKKSGTFSVTHDVKDYSVALQSLKTFIEAAQILGQSPSQAREYAVAKVLQLHGVDFGLDKNNIDKDRIYIESVSYPKSNNTSESQDTELFVAVNILSAKYGIPSHEVNHRLVKSGLQTKIDVTDAHYYWQPTNLAKGLYKSMVSTRSTNKGLHYKVKWSINKIAPYLK